MIKDLEEHCPDVQPIIIKDRLDVKWPCMYRRFTTLFHTFTHNEEDVDDNDADVNEWRRSKEIYTQ